MIHDWKKSGTPRVLDTLDGSLWTFYLTGSRFMQCARPDSDWDFITQDTPAVRRWLRDNGFTRDVFADYTVCLGSETNAVYERTQDAVKYQVQLVKNATLQCNVRDIINKYLHAEHIKADREERQELWNGIAAILRFKADTFLPF